MLLLLVMMIQTFWTSSPIPWSPWRKPCWRPQWCSAYQPSHKWEHSNLIFSLPFHLPIRLTDTNRNGLVTCDHLTKCTWKASLKERNASASNNYDIYGFQDPYKVFLVKSHCRLVMVIWWSWSPWSSDCCEIMTTMMTTIMTIKENSHLSLMFWFSLLRRASALLFIIKIKSIMSITTIYNGNRTVNDVNKHNLKWQQNCLQHDIELTSGN